MSKFDKFVAVDPLGRDDEEISMQEAVADEVNKRMGKAVEELREKYDGSKPGAAGGYAPASDVEPSGAAYRQARAEAARRSKAAAKQRQAVAGQRQAEDEELRGQLQARQDQEDSDDELLDGLDEDPEIRRLRELRLREMRAEHDTRADRLSKGHGQYRDVTQDDFLSEVTGSPTVVCHFYHRDFARCTIMHHHLSLLAPHHVECKFVRVDAEKTPFFVSKLQVRVLPCVVLFRDGIAFDRIEGFDGLAAAPPAAAGVSAGRVAAAAAGAADEWPTAVLARRLALAHVIQLAPEYREGGGEGGGGTRGRAMAALIREGLQESELSDEND